MSELQTLLADYLRLRRGLGHKLVTAQIHLDKFVADLDCDGIDTITIERVLKFVSDPAFGPDSTVPRQRLTAIRGFARYVSAIDPRCQVPPADLVRCRTRRRIPHVFTDTEIEALIDQARRSTPFPFRALTIDTMIRLLTVTGMRVGEVIRLDCGDVDFETAVLKVRDSKFRKGRDIPVSESTIEALRHYRTTRDLRDNVRTDCLFISLKGKPVIYNDFQAAFRRAVKAADIGSDRPSPPHIHDLRHRFAILTVTGWYRDGLDVEALLPRLSTYLGHREPRFTYWYLTATPELLGQAAERLEAAQQRQETS